MTDRFWTRVEKLFVQHPGIFYIFPFIIAAALFIKFWIKYG